MRTLETYVTALAMVFLTAVSSLADETNTVAFAGGKTILDALSMDGSLAAETHTPRLKLAGNKEFREGKFGQGFYVGTGTWLRLPLSNKTFNRNEGTIGFWFKPDQGMKDGKFRRMLSIGNEFSLHKDQFDCLSFHIGNKHVTTKAVSWKAGEWHHIAITWKNAEGEGDLSIYFDGDAYTTYLGRGRGFLTEDMMTDWLNIASFGVEECQLEAVVDDLAVFNVALNQDDVRALVGNGSSLKDILAGKAIKRFPPVVNLASRQKVIAQHPPTPYCAWSEFTDGEVRGWPNVSAPEQFCGKGPSWIQVDLGKTNKINMIRLWQDTKSVFYDVKVAVSLTNTFQGEEFVVWDTARNGTYEETPEGKLFVFPVQEARYIRCWNSGSINDKTVKGYGTPFWREISVFYDELKGR
jgi:hypothetical protein